MHMIQNKHRLCHRFQVDNENLEVSISDAADIHEKQYFKIKYSKPVTNCCRVLAQIVCPLILWLVIDFEFISWLLSLSLSELQATLNDIPTSLTFEPLKNHSVRPTMMICTLSKTQVQPLLFTQSIIAARKAISMCKVSSIVTHCTFSHCTFLTYSLAVN